MTDSKWKPVRTTTATSPLLIAALFAVAAAIVFHAWWPSYKADRDLERHVADCIAAGKYDGDRTVCIKDYYITHSDRMR